MTKEQILSWLKTDVRVLENNYGHGGVIFSLGKLIETIEEEGIQLVFQENDKEIVVNG